MAKGYRCARCAHQKKGCVSGQPCNKCKAAKIECVPETPCSRPTPAANSSHPPQITGRTPTQRAPPVQQDPHQNEEGATGDQPAANFQTTPRLTSLRTKATGPDLRPELQWSWVGNGQYCLTEGYDRVMAMKERGTKRRKLREAASAAQNNGGFGAAGGYAMVEQGGGPVAFSPMPNGSIESGMGMSFDMFGQPNRMPDVETRRQMSLNPTSATRLPAQLRFEPARFPYGRTNQTTQGNALSMNTTNDVTTNQQQHQALYNRVGDMTPPTTRAPSQQANGFLESLEIDRATHATEAEYGNLPAQQPAQRVDTPPLPGQDRSRPTRGTLMQQFGQARNTLATDAEHEALSTVFMGRREDTPPPPN